MKTHTQDISHKAKLAAINLRAAFYALGFPLMVRTTGFKADFELAAAAAAESFKLVMAAVDLALALTAEPTGGVTKSKPRMSMTRMSTAERPAVVLNLLVQVINLERKEKKKRIEKKKGEKKKKSKERERERERERKKEGCGIGWEEDILSLQMPYEISIHFLSDTKMEILERYLRAKCVTCVGNVTRCPVLRITNWVRVVILEVGHTRIK